MGHLDLVSTIKQSNMRPFDSSIFMTLTWSAINVATQQTKISVTDPLTGVNLQTGAAPARMEISKMYSQGGPAW